MVRFTYENQLEGCFQVSLRRVFCHGGGELVFILLSHHCSRSFLLTYDDPGVLKNTRLHTLRVVPGLLLLWVHKEVRKRNEHDGPNLYQPTSASAAAWRGSFYSLF